MTDTANLAALQSRYNSMVRAERASCVARVEEAKARVRELQQLRAMIDNQIANAKAALVAAELDATE